MQLDVLSVLQLPLGAQTGPFILQEDSYVTVQAFREQRRHRIASCLPGCGLFACGRHARYAAGASTEAESVRFALLKESAKPTAWLLQADEDAVAGLVRVDQLRGNPPQPPPLPAPSYWPGDLLLGLGLPPTFEREDRQPDGSLLPPGSTSCQVLLEPQPGAVGPRQTLVAHAFWRPSCPGKLVLAVARLGDVEAEGSTHDDGLGGQAPPLPQAKWHWHVIAVTGGFEYVGPALRTGPGRARSAAAALPSPEAAPAPVLSAVSLSWHPLGSALALLLTDSEDRSCVGVLGGANMDPLWHRRWEPDVGPTPVNGPAPSPRGSSARAAGMAWVPGSSLLAVVDEAGNLCLVDATGGARGAALLCGAIKYGESPLVRLGPILGKAAPLAASVKGAVNDFPRFTRSPRQASAGGGASSADSRSQGPSTTQRLGSERRASRYSLAFSTAGSNGAATDSHYAAKEREAGPSAATGQPPPTVLAVCNGDAIALVRINPGTEPMTPVANGYGAEGAGLFAMSSKSPPTAGTAGDTPDQDAVSALPGGGGGALRLELLDHGSSFGSSAVSTPYMLGLQRVSNSFATTPGPLATCRSNVSDALSAAPAWPLVWRSILTLQPAARPGVHGASALPPSTLAAAPNAWGAVGGLVAQVAGAASSVGAPSIVGGAASGGAYPSPANSTANLRYPSLVSVPPPPASVAPDSSLRGTAPGAGAGGAQGPTSRGAATGLGGAGGVGGGTGAAAANGPLPHAGLVCSAPAALKALQQGDVLVLRGCVAEALQHYPKAHIYGFLPAFLALIHLHRIDAAARLLRAYAHFTGQVASAAASASSAAPSSAAAAAAAAAGWSPGTPGLPPGASTAAALRQQWQSTMSLVLEHAFTDPPVSTISGAAAGVSGSTADVSSVSFNHAVHAQQQRNLPDSAVRGGGSAWGAASAEVPSPPQIKLKLPMERFRDHSGSGSPATAAAAAAAAAAAGTEAAVAGAGAPEPERPPSGGTIPAARHLATQLSLEPRTSNHSMLSVPEEAVLEVAVERPSPMSGEAPLPPLPPPPPPAPLSLGGVSVPPVLAPAQVVENIPSPKLPDVPADPAAAAAAATGAAAAAAHWAAAAGAALDDDEALSPPLSTGFSGMGALPPLPLPPAPPPPSPAAALQAMLCVCLQLLQLGCQAMAFVAFSAHNAGRHAAAYAAVDVMAMPIAPGSPRSPGGGMMSRQAMRRLSSTMRMRSLRTRSTSMFGASLSVSMGLGGGGAFGGANNMSPPGNSGGGAGPSPGGEAGRGLKRFGSAVTSRGGASAGGSGVVGVGSAGGAGARTTQSPHAQEGKDVRDAREAAAAAAVAAAAAASAARPPPPQPVVIGFPIPVVWQPLPNSGPASHLPQRPGSSAPSLRRHASEESNIALPLHASASMAATPAAAASSSAASPAAPRPAAMRLQLHHCAFDVTRLWQDASTQHVGLGHSAASVYLKPSYATGLLLMAHSCSAQLAEQQRLAQLSGAGGGGGGGTYSAPAAAAAMAARAGPFANIIGAGTPSSEVPSPARLNGHAGSVAEAGSKPGPPKGSVLRAGQGGSARVNWALLRTAAVATHAAVVWQHLNDWHRAAVLAFACANAMTQLGGGAADLQAEVQKRRRKSILADLPPAIDRELLHCESVDLSKVPIGGELTANGAGGGGGPGLAGVSNVVLARARLSCLRMGQRVLLSQVGACQKMEVQDACGVLLELVALPRRLLGPSSTVHISLLQKVCTRVVDLLPKRVCITPLLPASSVPPLLEHSHAGIRQQLLAHCGAAVARVLEELRLAAACGGTFVSLRETVQQIAEHSTVDSCVRMLLRWQGMYDGSRVDATAARLPEAVHDMVLLPDTSDWNPESVLPPLQDAFVASGLMTAADAAAVTKAALAASAAAYGDGVMQGRLGSPGGSAFAAAAAAATPGGAAAVAGVSGSGVPAEELQDLDELALLLDLSQLQHTLIAGLQPFLHDALRPLRRQPPPDAAAAAAAAAASGTAPSAATPAASSLPAGQSPAGVPPTAAGVPAPGAGAGKGAGNAAASTSAEDEAEDALVDSMLEDPGVISALPPVELASACLRLLLRLQWAMHCRAQVCSYMLRLVRLQAPAAAPQQGTATPSLASPAVGRSLQPPRASGPPQLQPQPLPQPATRGTRAATVTNTESGSPPPLTVSPRSFSHASVGHRSFRDYIQHQMAVSGRPSAAEAVIRPLLLLGAAPHSALEPSAFQFPVSGNSPVLVPAAPVSAASAQPPLQSPWSTSISPAASAALPAQEPPPPELLEAVSGGLLAWTAALVRADVFHGGSDLQACALQVLTMVRTGPVDLVAALDRALRRRSLFNARLAEQVNRLKKGAGTGSQPPASLAPTQPAPGTPASAASMPLPTEPNSPAPLLQPAPVGPAGVARSGSCAVPGGAMAPASSLATMDSGTLLGSGPADAAASGSSTSGRPPLGPRAGGVGRTGSFTPGPSPLGRPPSLTRPHLTPADMAAPIPEGAAEGELDSGTVRGSSAAVEEATEALSVAGSVATGIVGPASDGLVHHEAFQVTGGSDGLTAFGSGASMSMWSAPPPGTAAEAANASSAAHAPTGAGLRFHAKLPHILPPPTPATPFSTAYTPAPPSVAAADGSGRLAVQAAVSAAQEEIRSTSIKLLEYYADPSGALPSGLTSSLVAAANAAAAVADSKGGPDSAPRSPSGLGPVQQVQQGQQQLTRRPSGPQLMLGSRSTPQTVSRSTPHSTLLQCLVCELVRSTHSVNATISWKATLEGGRGLAGCFVHPILHGSRSTGGGAATIAGVGGATRGPSAGGGLGPSLSGEEEILGSSASGYLPGVEEAQQLLLSLLDVKQWGSLLKPPTGPPQPRYIALGSTGPSAGAPAGPPADAGSGAAFADVQRTSLGAAARQHAAHMQQQQQHMLAQQAQHARQAPPLVQQLAASTATDAAPAPGSSTARAAATAPSALSPSPRELQVHGSMDRANLAATLADDDSGTPAMPDGATSAAATPASEPGASRRDAAASDRRRTTTLSTPPESPSGYPNTGRMSFSTLTDGGADTDSGYPLLPSDGGAASTKAAADRHGNSSMKYSLNPAYGLQSPTPSNFSEFWEDASDLSPQSTRATPSGANTADGRASGGGARGALRRAVSGITLTETAHSPHGSGTPVGGRAHSPEPGTAHGHGHGHGPGHVRASNGQLVATGSGSLGPDLRRLSAVNAATANAAAAASLRETVGAGEFGTGNAKPTEAAAAPADAFEGPPGTVGSVAANGSLAAATPADLPAPSSPAASTSVDGDQPATLSYLVDLKMLDEIRNAVREAHRADADGGAAAESAAMEAVVAAAEAQRDHSEMAVVNGSAVAASAAAAAAASAARTGPPSATPSVATSDVSIRGDLSAAGAGPAGRARLDSEAGGGGGGSSSGGGGADARSPPLRQVSNISHASEMSLAPMLVTTGSGTCTPAMARASASGAAARAVSISGGGGGAATAAAAGLPYSRSLPHVQTAGGEARSHERVVAADAPSGSTAAGVAALNHTADSATGVDARLRIGRAPLPTTGAPQGVASPGAESAASSISLTSPRAYTSAFSVAAASSPVAPASTVASTAAATAAAAGPGPGPRPGQAHGSPLALSMKPEAVDAADRPSPSPHPPALPHDHPGYRRAPSRAHDAPASLASPGAATGAAALSSPTQAVANDASRTYHNHAHNHGRGGADHHHQASHPGSQSAGTVALPDLPAQQHEATPAPASPASIFLQDFLRLPASAGGAGGESAVATPSATATPSTGGGRGLGSEFFATPATTIATASAVPTPATLGASGGAASPADAGRWAAAVGRTEGPEGFVARLDAAAVPTAAAAAVAPPAAASTATGPPPVTRAASAGALRLGLVAGAPAEPAHAVLRSPGAVSRIPHAPSAQHPPSATAAHAGARRRISGPGEPPHVGLGAAGVGSGGGSLQRSSRASSGAGGGGGGGGGGTAAAARQLRSSHDGERPKAKPQLSLQHQNVHHHHHHNQKDAGLNPLFNAHAVHAVATSHAAAGPGGHPIGGRGHTGTGIAGGDGGVAGGERGGGGSGGGGGSTGGASSGGGSSAGGGAGTSAARGPKVGQGPKLATTSMRGTAAPHRAVWH